MRLFISRGSPVLTFHSIELGINKPRQCYRWADSFQGEQIRNPGHW